MKREATIDLILIITTPTTFPFALGSLQSTYKRLKVYLNHYHQFIWFNTHPNIYIYIYIYIYIGLNIFLSLNFRWILKLVHFKILDQFSHSSFEICEFNSFNQILLGLFDVSYGFQDCIWVVYTVLTILYFRIFVGSPTSTKDKAIS